MVCSSRPWWHESLSPRPDRPVSADLGTSATVAVAKASRPFYEAPPSTAAILTISALVLTARSPPWLQLGPPACERRGLHTIGHGFLWLLCARSSLAAGVTIMAMDRLERLCPS